jgi:hypothetical protein
MKRLVVVLAAVASLAQFTPAEAAPVLPARQRITFIGVERVARWENCPEVGYEVFFKNAFGQEAMRFTMTANWCWTFVSKQKGYRITRVRFQTKVWQAWWSLWDYEGVVHETTWGGVGQKVAGKYQQGEFRVCLIPKFGPICRELYPWMQIEVYARGGDNSTGGWS